MTLSYRSPFILRDIVRNNQSHQPRAHVARPSPLQAIFLFALFAALVLPTIARAQTPPPVPASKPAALSRYQRMVALWSDIPAYHDILTSKFPGARQNAALR